MFKYGSSEGLEATMLAAILQKIQNGDSIAIQIEFKTVQQSVEEALEHGHEPDYRKLADSQRDGMDSISTLMRMEGEVLDLALLMRIAFENNPDFYKLCAMCVTAYERAYPNRAIKRTDESNTMANTTTDSRDELKSMLADLVEVNTNVSRYGSLEAWLDTMNPLEKLNTLAMLQRIKRIADKHGLTGL